MVKNFLKELIITILLCGAIIGIMGVFLYNYMPIGKEIPAVPNYETPGEIKEMLNSNDSLEEEKIVMTYDIDSTDLNNYKKTQKYKPGKANPFSSYETEGEKKPGNDSGSNGSNGSNNNSQEKPNTNNQQNENKQENNKENNEEGYLHNDKGNIK